MLFEILLIYKVYSTTRIQEINNNFLIAAFKRFVRYKVKVNSFASLIMTSNIFDVEDCEIS